MLSLGGAGYEARSFHLTTDDPRPLTVTRRPRRGRLRSTNTPALRDRAWSKCCGDDPTSFGCGPRRLAHLSKHATFWYLVGNATERVPPRRRSRTQSRVDALPRRESAGLVDGEVTLEATSVSLERDGTLSLGIATALTADGRRAIANTRDPDLLHAHNRGPRGRGTFRFTNDGATNTPITQAPAPTP